MQTVMTARRTRLLVALLGLVLAGASLAQDDKRSSREREALRRTQQALRSAQAQQATLEREKAALAAEKDKLDDAAKKASAQLGSAQAQAGRARGELAKTESELALVRAELEALKSTSAGREQTLQSRVEELSTALREHQRLLAERSQTVTTVTTLLQRSTQSLANAEAKNRELYGIGRQLLEAHRRAGGEGVFGLDAVKLENEAEALRTEIEARRLVSGTAR